MVTETSVQWTVTRLLLCVIRKQDAPFALEMLRDIDKETVDFRDNFDGEEKEPVVLPSRFPNLLVNGSNGIAVGMATSIPPHNLKEVIDATLG